MSMREYPNSGYVAALEEVKTLLNEEQKAELQGILEEGGALDDIKDFLEEALPPSFPAFDVYQPSDEDIVDESMEQGEYYLVFNEDDLFDKVPKQALNSLVLSGIFPELANWSVYG